MGEGAVDEYHGVLAYAETKAYVKKVMALYQSPRHDFDASLTDASPALAAKPVEAGLKEMSAKKVSRK